MSLEPGGGPWSSHNASFQANSAVHSSRKSVTPLPLFEFRPGGIDSSGQADESPPVSPTAAMSIRPRSGGHKRGCSEFIGGDGRSGGLGLMSSSPTKGDDALPLPTPAGAPARPGGRRGHAHKRSGAISCHDLSGILQPAIPGPKARAESAPSSPVDSAPAPGPPSDAVYAPDPSPPRRQSLPQSGARRARVGFSDSVEVIPRPLSTISSETSTSRTTVHGGSISDGVSSTATTSGDGPPSASPSPSAKDSTRQRPSTAGAVMMKGYAAEEGSLRGPGSSSERPSPPPSRTWPFLPRVGAVEHAHSTERGSGRVRTRSPAPSSERRPGWRVEKSHGKVTGWAGSILSSKPRRKAQRQAPVAQPTPAFEHTEDRSSSPPSPTIEFDPENTCTIVSEPVAFVLPPPIATPPSGSPRRTSHAPDADAMSPVIDLDAALGPFNTPDLGPGASKGAYGGARRRLRGGATSPMGPGQDYHRRTESAPELAGMEHRRSSLQRLRSRSKMADVFEEDEEEEALSGKAVHAKTQDVPELGIGIQVVDSSDPEDSSAMNWDAEQPKIRQPSHSKGEGCERSSTGGKDSGCIRPAEPMAEAIQPIETPWLAANRLEDDVKIVDLDEHLQDLSLTGPFSEKMATVSEDVAKDCLVDGPHLVTLPPSQHAHLTPVTPSMTISSSASPELQAIIFDTPSAVSPSPLTSASSFTDERTIHSLLAGEPGPELRMSVDEAPSLTSDNSTMRSVKHKYGGPNSSDISVRGAAGRSGSVTSDATGIIGQDAPRPAAVKRSSLVSLSKLVGGSHAEKSKLSIETSAQPDSHEGVAKEKKRKRFKLMQLFRSKLAR